MKRFYWSVFSLIVILVVSAPAVVYGASVNSVFAASKNNVSAQKTVTASAIVVPAQVSELGFLISGIARDIPVKEGDTVKAGQTLMVLDTPDLQFAVTEAQASLRAAQAQAEIRSNEIIKKYRISYRLFDIIRLRLSVPHEVIEIANAGVQRAQASVEIAQANLAQGTLVAPHDGTIASIKVIPGEFVSSDQAVITLATLNTLQIETTDLSERDVPNVHIGDPADIFVEGLNRKISGKVVGISPMASTVGGDVIFKVTIAPDTQPEGLRWGMTAEVEIKNGG
ncbi:MAG TPA: efflux RND transporter periplasmic adaptor subunit [Anaerolineales bacterium]|nr:efflux RND transporter periplasmic adaptor subunit [Anaerolineales bacterium]